MPNEVTVSVRSIGHGSAWNVFSGYCELETLIDISRHVVTASDGGGVHPDTGTSRWFRLFTQTKFGIVIPSEMVKNDRAAAFTSNGQPELPPRLVYEISSLSGGTVS